VVVSAMSTTAGFFKVAQVHLIGIATFRTNARFCLTDRA
jgi:hypothetical protein